MTAPKIPTHHRREMEIISSKTKCRVCGYEGKIPRGGLGDTPPSHCGTTMSLIRKLKCGVCGVEKTQTLSLESEPATLATVTAQPPVARARTAEVPDAVADLVGKSWAGYEIVSQLGQGGMAVVYKAYQPRLERHVAIKFLLPQRPYADSLTDRFAQEARLIANLRHPNIVTVLDFGEHQGLPYLVMEYVEGETLEARLERQLPQGPALGIVSQVAHALDYAHGRGVVHRDVKPSNILLAREDWALLSDFGIAKVVEGSAHLTQTGMALGTPEYMSPEQCRGAQVDGRSDIYSLGVVLFEMLTGRPPFTGETPMSVLFQHVNDPLPPPRTLNPSIPETLEAVVMKATGKDPSERFASAKEMAQALESSPVVGAFPPYPPGPTTHQAAAPKPLAPAEAPPETQMPPSPPPPGRIRRRNRKAIAALLLSTVGTLLWFILLVIVALTVNTASEAINIPQCATLAKARTETSELVAPPDLTIRKSHRESNNYTATIHTSMGRIDMELAGNTSPNTVNSFVFLARCKFFDGLTFHRVVPGFVIQGGDPSGNGTGGPVYSVTEPPPPNTKYVKGTVAMAKADEPAGTPGSQFFIVTADQTLPPDFALLGKVTGGFDALAQIETVPRGQGDASEKPLQPIIINQITISEPIPPFFDALAFSGLFVINFLALVLGGRGFREIKRSAGAQRGRGGAGIGVVLALAQITLLAIALFQVLTKS